MKHLRKYTTSALVSELKRRWAHIPNSDGFLNNFRDSIAASESNDPDNDGDDDSTIQGDTDPLQDPPPGSGGD